MYKIRYSINILPSIGKYIHNDPLTGTKEIINPTITFMNLCTSSAELDIFETSSLSELIQFKWSSYAKRHHLMGCIMHMTYISTLVVYINVVYINNTGTEDDKKLYAYLLGGGMLYPLFYESR